MKKIGIYDPYLHILGGGERYALSIAACFETADITIFSSNPEILKQAQEKFGISTAQMKVAPWPKDRSVRNTHLAKLDEFFYVTDGSLFWSLAKKNILIIQSPLHIPPANLATMIKLFSWKKIICYSQFVASFIQTRLHKSSDILFVPIDEPQKQTLAKKNMILSVGRFFTHLHSKKQLEMVALFGDLYKKGGVGMELTFVGSVDPGAQDYFKGVQTAAKGLPIHFKINVTHRELIEEYKKAKIYWHAAGFGEDIQKYPEKAEHFGVSTIEAMSYGAVPVIYGAGGQTEIVTSGANGFVWTKPEELSKYTLELLQNVSLYKKLSAAAMLSSKNYSRQRFCERLYEILEK